MLSHCRHCGNPLRGAETRERAFCCLGCEAAYRTLEQSGLLRYYDLRQEPRTPSRPEDPASALWIERTEAWLREQPARCTLRMSVDGLHCAACVWLLEELTKQTDSTASINVNPALGTAELNVPTSFDLARFGATLDSLGYRLGPDAGVGRRSSDDLLWRVGVTVAIALNVMSFAIARYAGLAEDRLGRTLATLELGLTTVALVIGGPVFFRSAWGALRRGLLHMDLPISIGLLASWAGSVLLTLSGKHDAAFYDTASIFLALMLLGRFLRERVLERNRTFLRGHNDAASLLVRRKRSDAHGTHVSVVPARSIEIGDELVLGPRDVTPVAGTLLEGDAYLSSAWITGESTERRVSSGEDVLAGMSNAEPRTISIRASETLATSNLLTLMQTPRSEERYGDSPSTIETYIARYWVLGVAVAAGLAALWSSARGATAHETLSLVTTILVVTCPCGFGIAAPLAQELTHLKLRREGILVRSCTLLERVLGVRNIVFDKTGTLTDVRLDPASVAALGRLDSTDALVLANLAQRSRHPKSRALSEALAEQGASAWIDLEAHEEPGHGLTTHHDGHTYSLGSPAWRDTDAAGDVELSKDGRPVLTVTTDDRLIPGTAPALRELADQGYALHLLSGDTAPRARKAGEDLGIAADRVTAEATPQDKARYLRAQRGGTLFVGDGLNDALAATAATVSGTPSRGATFLASRTDFYLLGAGVPTLPRLFAAATVLATARRRTLTWAALYNVAAVTLAFAGLMTPLAAAVLMPLSTIVSIGLVLLTTGQAKQTPRDLEPRSLAWTPST